MLLEGRAAAAGVGQCGVDDMPEPAVELVLTSSLVIFFFFFFNTDPTTVIVP